MTDAAHPQCRVEGVKYLGAEVSEAEVCALFRQRLADNLGADSEVESLSVELRISKEGTIDASVKDASNASGTPYPSVSVDIMDRALRLGDVETVAEFVANAMKSE